MRKKDELTRRYTCMSHAHPEEMLFVLIGRDPAAPVAIRAWVAERIRIGKNVETDPQVGDALMVAGTMELEGRQWADVPHATALSNFGNAALVEALAESIKLQNHYATLLNQHDGGERATFVGPLAWIQRLREVAETIARLDDDGYEGKG